MTIVNTGILETYTPSVSTQSDQNIINQKVADNIEVIRRFGIGIGDVTSLHIHSAITADNFTLYKKAGFISFYQFNSSTGNIDGVFDSATLQEGDQFLLVNKASTPSTNTVTLALGSYSLLGSSDTSIVINSNTQYIYLVYIGSSKFIRITDNTDLLNTNNTWTGSNDFFISDIEILTLGKNRLLDTGIEIGRSENTGTKAFIDLKWGSGTTKDYDIRMSNYTQYSFGLESDTKLHLITDNSEMRLNLNLIPHVNNTHAIGSSSYKWTEVWATNGTIQTSDKETKENIKETSLGLDFILALKPVSWKWKNEQTKQVERIKYKKVYDKKGNFKALEQETLIDVIPEKKYKRLHHGFINQDVEDLLKEKSIDTNDFSGFIKDKETGERALRYESFIAPMVKAIQEQNKIIQELKQEIEALKNA